MIAPSPAGDSASRAHWVLIQGTLVAPRFRRELLVTFISSIIFALLGFVVTHH
jgi:hypothetical protein